MAGLGSNENASGKTLFCVYEMIDEDTVLPITACEV